MFVTVFYGILNTLTGEVEYVNGGHNSPYLISSTGTVKQLLPTGGVILGCLDHVNYASKKIKLAPGDTLYLYTDGVTEAFNNKDEAFGEQRLEEFLIRHNKLPIDKLLHQTITDIQLYAEGVPQSDDITLMVLRYEG